MDLEGGHFCIVCQKVGVHGPSDISGLLIQPCSIYFNSCCPSGVDFEAKSLVIHCHTCSAKNISRNFVTKTGFVYPSFFRFLIAYIKNILSTN